MVCGNDGQVFVKARFRHPVEVIAVQVRGEPGSGFALEHVPSPDPE
jgi:hypothetical protein